MRLSQTVKVIEVKEPPALKNPAMLKGIRTREEAASWGNRNRYAVVYFMSRKQKVYAERLSVRVDAAAKGIETRSSKLVETAERGESMIENAVLASLVLIFVLACGWFLGWPW